MSAEDLWFWTWMGAFVLSIWMCLGFLAAAILGPAIGLGGEDDEEGRCDS